MLKKRIELFHYYSNEGVPHESELLKNAIEIGEWTPEKEDSILELKYIISDNEKNIHNIIPQQRAGIEKIIESKKKDLSDIVWERKQILGRNIEDLIDEDLNDYVSFLSFYKDESCTIPIVSNYEEFQKMELSELNNINSFLSIHYNNFNEEKVKAVSCMPFFLNKFSYSKDDIQTFLGKPVNELTHNQNSIFSLGVRNLNIINQAEGSPPDIYLNVPAAEIVKWYDIQYSILIGKRNQSK